jgi:hypothetical protein
MPLSPLVVNQAFELVFPFECMFVATDYFITDTELLLYVVWFFFFLLFLLTPPLLLGSVVEIRQQASLGPVCHFCFAAGTIVHYSLIV